MTFSPYLLLTALTGFGYHGDFMMGWEGNFLQAAVDQCTNDSGRIQDCPLFTIQDEYTQTQCNMPVPNVIVAEKVSGTIGDSLPGNVAIQYGPQPATMGHPGAPQPAPQTTASPPPVPVPSVSYSPGNTATSSGSYAPGDVFIQTSDSASSSTAEAPSPTPTPSPTTTDDGLPIISTDYVTNGDVVSEIIWKEAVVTVTDDDDITVTVTVTPSATPNKARRQAHVHAHAHQHLGRHGRPVRH
jgi:hypothetical protein